MQPDNLHSIKDDMQAFISGLGLRRLSGYVTEDIPSVMYEDDDPDGWKTFAEHAKAAGVPFLTMSEVVLEKTDVAMLLEQLRSSPFLPSQGELDLDEAESLVRHVGKVGYLQLGFAHQGIMFLFEISTDWYEQFQDLMEAVTDLGGMPVDDAND